MIDLVKTYIRFILVVYVCLIPIAWGLYMLIAQPDETRTGDPEPERIISVCFVSPRDSWPSACRWNWKGERPEWDSRGLVSWE